VATIGSRLKKENQVSYFRFWFGNQRSRFVSILKSTVTNHFERENERWRLKVRFFPRFWFSEKRSWFIHLS